MISHQDKEFTYFNCPPRIAEKIGAEYIKKHQLYRVPTLSTALIELQTAYPSIDSSVSSTAYDELKRIIKQKNREDCPGEPRLRPYQRVDVDFLKYLPCGGVFNQQRTGKTPVILTVLKEKGFQKILIVVPSSLLYQWKREVKTWLGKEALIIQGRKRKSILEDLGDEFTLITSYETLRRDTELYKKFKFDAMVVDEAHRLRGRKTQQAQAIFKIGRQAKYRYALTGTPTVRKGDDIFSILHFLDPKRFSSYWKFVDRYMNVQMNYAGYLESNGVPKRKDELQEIIFKLSTNRKRKSVMKWLPDKEYITVALEPSDKQKRVYRDLEETFEYQEDGEELVNAPSILSLLTRLRQVATAPSMLGIEADSAKEKYLMDWLQDNPNEPVIIFSTFTSYLKQLGERLEEKYSVGYIHGEISAKGRQEVADKFQAGEIQIILANSKAAGVGLTLDRAETVIFLDKEWNPSDNEQAEDRAIPISEERNHNVTVISLVLADTYDEKIEKLLENKYNITEVVNNGGLKAVQTLFIKLQENGYV